MQLAAKLPAGSDPRPAHYGGVFLEVASRYSEADPHTFRTIFSLVSAYDAVFNHLSRRMARYSLTVPGFNVLMILAHGDNRKAGCPMHAIGDLLWVSRSNITGLVDSLEKKSWVRREEHPSDRRSKLVRITPEGDRLLKKILPGHLTAARRVTSVLSEKEIGQLCRLLAKLREGVSTAQARESDD